VAKSIEQSLIGSPERLQTRAYGQSQLPYMDISGTTASLDLAVAERHGTR
jgi:hypothetical protein